MGTCCSNDGQETSAVEDRQDASLKVKINSRSNLDDDDAKEETKEAAEEEEAKYNGDNDIDIDIALNQITVHVIQGRNLPAYDIGPGARSDPYVKVSIGKRAYITESIQRELNPVWNSTFVKKGTGILSRLDRIEFEVFDRDKFTKDDWMGKFVIDIPEKAQLTQNIITPVQWIPLRDRENNRAQGEIQVQVKYILNADQLNKRYFTHILELNVKNGLNLRDMDFLGKSDPYVRVEWGAQAYKTRVINDQTVHPTWDEVIFLFIHQDFQSKYQLKFTVLDQDFSHDDSLGCAYLSAAEIFDSLVNQQCTKTLNLRLQSVNFDKGLQQFDVKDENGEPRNCGNLVIECKVRPREEFQEGFTDAMFNAYDTDRNGYLDKTEVGKMMTQLRMMDDDFDVGAWMSKFDMDYNENLDRNEVKNMLFDAEFQQSPIAAEMIHLYLKKQLNEPSKVLMKPFVNTSGQAKCIDILHRNTGLVVQEFIPGYVNLALKLVYNVKLARAIAQKKAGKMIVQSMSVKRGQKMDSPESRNEIEAFIDQYSIDKREFIHKIGEFATFNDFFARPINVDKYRPPIPDDDMLVLSPADCRMIVFDTILNTSMWIKGDEFTLESLLGPRRALLNENPNLMGGSFFISRLAPQDYHRWHYPVSGEVTAITPIDGALYTVNPIAINKNVNVFTENKRCIIEINAGERIGTVVMFAIAATMVGSYNLYRGANERDARATPLKLNVGDTVKVGDVAGEFRFGGSTVLTLFEGGRVKFDDDLLQNSAKIIETLMSVRARVGRIHPKN